MVSRYNRFVWPVPDWCGGFCRTICLWGVLSLPSIALAAPAAQTTFPTPEAGVAALVEALTGNNQTKLSAMLGPHGNNLISSGDPVADRHNREAFVKAYQDAHVLTLEGNTQATLTIGSDEWPMPIPLKKNGHRWRFDTQRGEREILARRIGRNELSAVQVCLAIVDAQDDFVALHQHRDGVIEYAAKFLSTPGQHDGLYWQSAEEEPESPLGPLLATAALEGYPTSKAKVLAPYHGYFYRILTKQGTDAPGEAREYLVKGHMIGGFAVIAYPARYGVSGVMSFIVNQDGLVYEKDLGKNTTAVASTMTTFNPDRSWKPVAPSPGTSAPHQ
ncbi:MAG TPA: DUF2950 domain-containing protein [Nitrospira sp.]